MRTYYSLELIKWEFEIERARIRGYNTRYTPHDWTATERIKSMSG
jgi:hypothetical protein